MTFVRVLKSAIVGAIFLFLTYQGLWQLSEMPASVGSDGLLPPNNHTLFGIALWAWLGLGGWTGTLLGMMHASPAAGAAARKKFRGTVEFLFWVWAAFFLAHLGTLAVYSVHGGSFMAAGSLLMTVGLLMFWLLTRPRESTVCMAPVEPGWSV